MHEVPGFPSHGLQRSRALTATLVLDAEPLTFRGRRGHEGELGHRSSRSSFPGLSSKEPFTSAHPHQENSSARSAFPKKKCLSPRILELGGKVGLGRECYCSALCLQNIPTVNFHLQTLPSSCQCKQLACFTSPFLQQHRVVSRTDL